MSGLIQSPDWQRQHPLASFPAVDLRALQREALPSALRAFELYLDLYNVVFRSLAGLSIAALRGDSDLSRIESNINELVDAYWTVDGNLDVERIGWEWAVRVRQKYLLWLAHRVYILNIATLTDVEAEKILFENVDAVNLLHSLCLLDDAELQRLRNDCRIVLLFDGIHALVARLRPRVVVSGCQAEIIDLSDDQHRRLLYCFGIELAYRLSGSYLCWETIEGSDPFSIIRSIYPSYALNHEQVFLSVLQRHAAFYAMYRNTIHSMLFVLGFLAPFPLRSMFKQLADNAMVPGSCEHDRDEALVVLAQFVRNWFFGDYEGHLGTEFRFEMPRWVHAPVDEKSPKARSTALVSAYAYYTPSPSRWKGATVALFCSGARTFHAAHCDPAAAEIRQLDPPPPLMQIPTAARAALDHGIGQLAAALHLSRGDADEGFLALFESYVGVSRDAAQALIRITRNSPRATTVLRRMAEMAAAVNAPSEIAALIKHEIGYIERPNDRMLDGLFGTKMPFYGDRDRNPHTVAANVLTKLIKNFESNVKADIEKIEKALREPPGAPDPGSVCNPLLTALMRVAICPESARAIDTLLQGGISLAKGRAPQVLWRHFRESAYLDDLQRRIGDRIVETGPIPLAQVSQLAPPEQTARAIDRLAAMGVIARKEDGTIAFSERFRLGAL